MGENGLFCISSTVVSTLIFVKFTTFSIDNTSDQYGNQGTHYSRKNEENNTTSEKSDPSSDQKDQLKDVQNIHLDKQKDDEK